jgi:hypothetical protein
VHQNPLAQKVVDALSPLVGKTMAESVLTVQARRLGIEVDGLSPADLPRLARQFETHLKIFVGTEKASQIGRLVETMG